MDFIARERMMLTFLSFGVIIWSEKSCFRWNVVLRAICHANLVTKLFACLVFLVI